MHITFIFLFIPFKCFALWSERSRVESERNIHFSLCRLDIIKTNVENRRINTIQAPKFPHHPAHNMLIFISIFILWAYKNRCCSSVPTSFGLLLRQHCFLPIGCNVWIWRSRTQHLQQKKKKWNGRKMEMVVSLTFLIHFLRVGVGGGEKTLNI